MSFSATSPRSSWPSTYVFCTSAPMLVRAAARPRAWRAAHSSAAAVNASWLLSPAARVPTLPPSSAIAARPLSSSPVQRIAADDSPKATNTISDEEIAHFSRLSAHWWDPTGEFGLLHRMNPARIEFLRGELLRVHELDGPRWLRGKDVLDVGCGGGIFAEVRSLGSLESAARSAG